MARDGAGPPPPPPRMDLERALRRRRRPARERLDVWALLDDRTDLAAWRPRLAPDVETAEFPLHGGGTYVLMASHRDEKYLRMNGWEARIAARLDGQRSLHTIAAEQLAGDDAPDVDSVIELVLDLQRHGLLADRYVNLDEALRRALDPVSARRRRLRTFLRTQTVESKRVHGAIAGLYRAGIRHLFRPAALAMMAAVAVVGAICFFAVVSSHRFTLSTQGPAQEGLILIGMNTVLILLHELGHALTIVHFGRRVNGAGAQIYFGSLVLFIDSTDALMLDRRRRMTMSAAGAFAETTVAGAASIAMFLAPDAAFSAILYKFAILNYFVIFLNLVPLLELDGYWILSDWLRIPDLRARSLSFIRRELVPKLAARARFTRAETGLALYGIVGVAFSVFVFAWSFRFWRSIFGPPIGRLWRAGVPTRLMVLFLAVLVGAPLIRASASLVRALARRIGAAAGAVVFRLQTRWRVEAAELVDALPLFGDLSEETLSDLAGRVRRRVGSPGEKIVAQGDRGSSFFVVGTGVAEVVDIDPHSGEEKVVRVLGSGDSFGELAVLTGTPRRATVRAITTVDLFEIDKGTFDRLLAPSVTGVGVGPTMQDITELRELPPFAALEAGALLELMEHGSWVHADAGEVFVRTGEKGDAFYVVRSGRVEVRRGGSRVAVLGPGNHFGELSLLRRAPRAATVRAVTHVVAYRVDRLGFDRLLRSAFRRGTLRSSGAGGSRVSSARARSGEDGWTAGTAARRRSARAGSAAAGSARTTRKTGRSSSSSTAARNRRRGRSS